MRRFLAALVVLVSLTACGAAEQAAPQPTAAPAAPRATATTAPQPTLTSAPAPTARAATTPGLGISRAVLQSKFEAAPFRMTFRDAPDRDGAPVVQGTSAVKGIEVELIGPADNVHEAQVQITVGDDGASSKDALEHMLAMLEVTTPSIANPTEWLAPHLERALKEHTDVAIEGDRTITIITATEIKYILLSVLPGPR